MLYRATRSITGKITMIKGEVRDIDDPDLEKDLIRCGYAVAVETPKKKAVAVEETSEAVTEVKPKATRKKSGGAKNADNV